MPNWPCPPDCLIWRPSASADPRDGFPIRHLGAPHISAHVKLAHHAVHQNFQVQLSHPGNNRLAGVRIGVHFKSGIFLRQLGQRVPQFFLVGLGLGFDGHGDDGGGEIHSLQNDGGVLIANRVARRNVLQSHGRSDITRVNLGDLFPLIGMHLQQARNTLIPVAARIVNRVTLLEVPGINPQEGQLPHEGVRHDLENQRRERLSVVRLADQSFSSSRGSDPSIGGTSRGEGR